MENEDSLKIERLEDDGLQDVSGGAGDYVSHYQCPKTGKQLSSYDPYFARVPILEAGHPRHPGGVPLLIR